MDSMDDHMYRHAETIWDYMRIRIQPEPADCLLILGSRDERVAAYAAHLSQQHEYGTVMVSGGLSHTQDLLATSWGMQTEAEHFAEIYRENQGRGEILLESKARNTGQNATLSYAMLHEHGISPASLMIVTKPYQERRALATFQAQWPDRTTVLLVSSPTGGLGEYCNDEQPIDVVVNIMVGDLQRIIEYPKLGFQVEQIVPDEVMQAMEVLISAGYTKHLVQ